MNIIYFGQSDFGGVIKVVVMMVYDSVFGSGGTCANESWLVLVLVFLVGLVLLFVARVVLVGFVVSMEVT